MWPFLFLVTLKSDGKIQSDVITSVQLHGVFKAESFLCAMMWIFSLTQKRFKMEVLQTVFSIFMFPQL